MGTWGTAISSNDTYADIYSQFIDLYNEGLTVDEITTQLINENQETISLEEDAPNFWFAIANGQWECKALSKVILSKVEKIIHSGKDLRIWKELGASEKDLKTRETILSKFLEKLKIEKEKPRKRVKKKLYDSLFKKGDCLTYIMNNGNYGGAFVLTDEQNTEIGENYIAITTIDQAIKPTILDFKQADVYVRYEQQFRRKGQELVKYWNDEPQIGGFYALGFKKQAIDIEVVGQLPINKDYIETKDYTKGFGWAALKILIPFKEEYTRINGPAKKTLKLSELIYRNNSFKSIKGFFEF